MGAVKRKVTDMTVDELKGIIHDAISSRFAVEGFLNFLW